jgi:hypothetical protein
MISLSIRVIMSPLQGLESLTDLIPGALPQAFALRPFGAYKKVSQIDSWK